MASELANPPELLQSLNVRKSIVIITRPIIRHDCISRVVAWISSIAIGVIKAERMGDLVPNQMLFKRSKLEILLVLPKNIKPAIGTESGPFTTAKIGSTFNANISCRSSFALFVA